MATETKEKPATEAIVGPVRLSYLTVFKPRFNKQKERNEYSVVLLIPKESSEFCADSKAVGKSIADLIKTAIEGKFGKVPAKWENPLKDGDTETDNDDEPRQPGYWYVNASAKEEFPPALIDGGRNVVTGGWGSGDWGRVKIKAYAYDFEGKKGVGIGLRAIQFLKHDEQFGGGDPTAGFDEVEGDGPRTDAVAPATDADYDPFA